MAEDQYVADRVSVLTQAVLDWIEDNKQEGHLQDAQVQQALPSAGLGAG